MVFELKRGLPDDEWAEVSQWIPLLGPRYLERARQGTIWVVDRERHAYFVRVAAWYHQQPDVWYLLWDGHVTMVGVWEEGHGDNDVAVDVTWRLDGIGLTEPASDGNPSDQELVVLVEEALLAYGPGPRAKRGTIVFERPQWLADS